MTFLFSWILLPVYPPSGKLPEYCLNPKNVRECTYDVNHMKEYETLQECRSHEKLEKTHVLLCHKKDFD